MYGDGENPVLPSLGKIIKQAKRSLNTSTKTSMFVNNCFQQNIIKNQYFYDIMGEDRRLKSNYTTIKLRIV